MNKYLEKIASFEKQALNAQAAREMAKKVGVIADPESNWKYALRNLRDGRGNPLEGQPRREALTRLAGGISSVSISKWPQPSVNSEM